MEIFFCIISGTEHVEKSEFVAPTSQKDAENVESEHVHQVL